MIFKGTEQVGPRLIEPLAGGLVEQVLHEETIVAVVLDARMEEIPLGRVVRVFEGKWNRVAVGWSSFAMRNLRQQAGEFHNARLPRCERFAGRIGQQGGVGLNLGWVVAFDN